MPKPNVTLATPLRTQIAVVSVNRERFDEKKFRKSGEIPGSLLVHTDDEKDPTYEHGTPAQVPNDGKLHSSIAAREPAPRQVHEVHLLPHLTPIEAAVQLCRLFGPHATPASIPLTLALVKLVGEQNLLPGFSSAVTAAACVKVASDSLLLAPLVSKSRLERLKIFPDAIRLAYNSLWIKRLRLSSTIRREGGGHVAMLPVPKTADGHRDDVSWLEGLGHAFPLEKLRKRRRHEKFMRKPSQLKYVRYALTDEEDTQAKADEIENEDEEWFDAMDIDTPDTSEDASAERPVLHRPENASIGAFGLPTAMRISNQEAALWRPWR